MKIERVKFLNPQGNQLSGSLFLPLDEKPRFFAVFAHCFTCTKNLKAVNNISNTLSQLGVAVLSFDFTGLGSSEGVFEDTHFTSNVADLVAASDFLKDNYEAPKLLIGHSLGGTAVIFAAEQLDETVAVVTIGAPSDPEHVKRLFKDDVETIKKQGSAKVNIGGRSFYLRKDFIDDLENKNLPDTLSKMRKAFLFLHSPQDQIVDISNAATLFQNAFHPKSFITLDGADHLLSEEHESRYVGELISVWSKKYLPEEKPENETKGHQVKVRLFGEGYTSEIKTPYHRLLADEPAAVGGDNLGPTPYDLLMASLGTCTAMTLKMYADRKGWDLKEINVYLDHDKVHKEDSVDFEKKGSKISRFTRSLEIEGELDESMKAKLLEIADKCPVHRTLHEEIIIETKFKS
ncbi:bifunctional alpha/beta hydrolase/OsmC family protein [Aquiflexum sp. TKW24L]|uniref:bifunctional alpha/beta hydrolase/OsmC family protein n=1 Tax=Aquiflexum sp. TKW24L TaxID=2942212 RepID=UPI0020BF0929|nr:bifunctional alpha/beta hydrolase/OsmC family protein [Aquiflexum sp. TKW24L]MCL6258248.1 bifunctional alpha/beta hydrolase/OsmC family protein [Aquiflexum sp. TKW24L]